MKRQIITIDEEACTGCGECIPNCPEGALQVIDGKARLISDLFCDGLGACVGTCPEGAMSVEEREAEPYDEARVMENIIAAGPNTIQAHLRHLDEHGETELLQVAEEVLTALGLPIPEHKEQSACSGAPCPGSLARLLVAEPSAGEPSDEASVQASQLRQWPIQLQLLNPGAGYFEKADLLVCADCVPFAYPDFHRRFLKGKILVVFCPKLDQTIDPYIDKLATIFRERSINSISIVRMEVPCCGGTERIVEMALAKAGKSKELAVKIISIRGEIL